MAKEKTADTEAVDTHSKALAINLDPTIFGSFAEIGAGQETARWFLRVGAASGTVAKTISAYDKLVSDDLYGGGIRYVSKPRLEAMLDAEWRLLTKQIAEREHPTRAFVFANTVSARNYAGTNQCHGWLGLRFMRVPGAEVTDIIVHVNLLGKTNVSQQEALGILGVNLIYAAYLQAGAPADFLSCLGEGIEAGEIEIDFIQADSLFSSCDQKQLLIALVTSGLSEGVILPHANEYGSLVDLLYKKPIVVEPGRFVEQELIHVEMLGAALDCLKNESADSQNAAAMFSLSSIDEEHAETPALSNKELLSRANSLLNAGFDVLITPHLELYKISALLSGYTKRQIRFVMGLSVLIRVLATSYTELQGRVLEGLARLFSQDVRVYVYPMKLNVLQSKLTEEQSIGWKISNTDDLLEADEIEPPPPIGHLYAYLLSASLIESLKVSASKPQEITEFKQTVSLTGTKPAANH